jgi:hypothetical protein
MRSTITAGREVGLFLSQLLNEHPEAVVDVRSPISLIQPRIVSGRDDQDFSLGMRLPRLPKAQKDP